MLTMVDVVEMSALAGVKFDALAGYVNGRDSNYPTYEPMIEQHPQLARQHRIISIAPQAFLQARCLDMEPQDALLTQFPAWHAENFVGGGLKAVAYTSASQMADLIAVLDRSKLINAVWRWSAHYTGAPHICGPKTCGYPQAHMTQWTDKYQGGNRDASEVPAEVFQVVETFNYHYERYPNRTFLEANRRLNEFETVVEYDRRMSGHVTPESRKRIDEVLRPELRIERDRVFSIATVLDPLPNGHPNWGPDHRGWRWNKLNARLHGKVTA